MKHHSVLPDLADHWAAPSDKNPSWLGVEWRFHYRDFQEHPNMIRWLVVPFCLHLVGGFNPSEKYESELGWLSHILWKINNVPNHQPAIISPIHPHILSGWRFRHVLTHPKKTLVISTTHPKCIWNNISTVEPPARHVLIPKCPSESWWKLLFTKLQFHYGLWYL